MASVAAETELAAEELIAAFEALELMRPRRFAFHQ